MTRDTGIPIFLLNLFIAWNFSTIGRTLPGLQYMISRTRYMAVLRVRWTFGESRAVGDGRWAIGDDGLDKRGHRPPPIADRRQSHRPPPIPTALLCNGFANSIARRERSSHLACPFHHPGQLPEAPMATTATTTSTKGRFVWHELLTKDPVAAQDFYTKVIGWGTQKFE